MTWIDWTIMIVPMAFVMYMGFYSRKYIKGVSREEDAPGLKKLKRLAALDSTQLENLPEDLKPGRK